MHIPLVLFSVSLSKEGALQSHSPVAKAIAHSRSARSQAARRPSTETSSRNANAIGVAPRLWTSAYRFSSKAEPRQTDRFRSSTPRDAGDARDGQGPIDGRSSPRADRETRDRTEPWVSGAAAPARGTSWRLRASRRRTPTRGCARRSSADSPGRTRSEKRIGPPARISPTPRPWHRFGTDRYVLCVQNVHRRGRWGRLGTLRDAPTPASARLGAERSSVQIRPPRLLESLLRKRASAARGVCGRPSASYPLEP
jgi:hypothetical protein